MKAKLKSILICTAGCRHKLILDTDHVRSSYGLGVMRIARTDRIFDGATLHVEPGSRIVTTDPRAVCGALGIPFPDPQVQEAGHENV